MKPWGDDFWCCSACPIVKKMQPKFLEEGMNEGRFFVRRTVSRWIMTPSVTIDSSSRVPRGNPERRQKGQRKTLQSLEFIGDFSLFEDKITLVSPLINIRWERTRMTDAFSRLLNEGTSSSQSLNL